MKTTKQQRLRYRLHYCLRKQGCRVMAAKRYVIRKAAVMNPLAEKHCRQLADMGYCVQNPIFEETIFFR
ncbi:MAG: hypothetical protein LBV41_13490 [Cytophagaceae bacterium]|jgi:hypothetical protein|nr:hypothetical protein [Cytophagaceae bacterium]